MTSIYPKLAFAAVGAVFVTFSCPKAAPATTIIFQDRTSFNQALDSDPSLIKTVEGWDNLPQGTIIPSGSTLNGITYTLTTGDAAIVGGVNISPFNNLFFSTLDFSPTLDTITFGFEQPILAFGISLPATFGIATGDYFIETDIGDVAPSFYDAPPGAEGKDIGAFAGLISDQPFSSVTLHGVANARYGMDDLTFARSRTDVPEPSTLLGLLSLSALSLGLPLKRRNRI
ncbi:MAG: PEP-CTERM sorting domain-containing protein [Coleofasciculus sp. G3-WIS-01]|uniref:PEP-CTERM sorting domain-containing protein n=1 Tax=Coleofasciculus sp. G3-WIS-01 TaxID=3069528 RepID=UPI0032F5BC21